MTTQKTIMDLERKFWQALTDMDIDSAVSLLDERCTVAGVRGIHYFTPAEYKAMALSADTRVTSYEFFDEGVLFPAADIAIASYRARQTFTVGGKSQEMLVYDTTTWVKKGGRWVACAHTEAPEQNDSQTPA